MKTFAKRLNNLNSNQKKTESIFPYWRTKLKTFSDGVSKQISTNRYCWTSYGKVFVRKDDTSKIIHIQNEAQIHHLMQEK
ncbi:unnamed protein product [Euphydryas editha]|uniref:FP protein C-terminal domain-containing protein n=1 Tax=Euphydryas editha TaxID=104508 RepID=A0AAU9V3T5_EUPED|nr:unnamed protein product [Euphydryas editha]